MVRISRVGSGVAHSDSELDDDALGFVATTDLNPRKARVLLRMAPTEASDVRQIQRYFVEY